jgi:hypothetical protein
MDWPAFHRAKRRWGVSLKALIYRAHSLKLISDAAYRRANAQLAEWGNPEPVPLGPPESPSLLGMAIAMFEDTGITIDDIAEHAAVPASRVRNIVNSATDLRPLAPCCRAQRTAHAAFPRPDHADSSASAAGACVQQMTAKRPDARRLGLRH